MQTPKQSKPPAVFLMGPTASGKTRLAIKLCQTFKFEIISVDSALVYKGLDIGTAKPTPEEQQLAHHHLIDFRDPANPYTVADFREDALTLMQAITDRGNTPLLVGGTMMYFKALLQGIADLPAADPTIREALVKRARIEGWPALHNTLAEVDPQAAQRIHPNDSQRIQRALEVYQSSGISLTAWQNRDHTPPSSVNIEVNTPANRPWSKENIAKFPYTVTSIALSPAERNTLHQRIEIRFKLMLEQGLLEEVTALFQRGDLSADLPAVRAVGYRQVWDYLSGNIDYATMVERGVVATRQLAKRQITWLRSWSELHWLETDDEALLWQQTLKLIEGTGTLRY